MVSLILHHSQYVYAQLVDIMILTRTNAVRKNKQIYYSINYFKYLKFLLLVPQIGYNLTCSNPDQCLAVQSLVCIFADTPPYAGICNCTNGYFWANAYGSCSNTKNYFYSIYIYFTNLNENTLNF